MQAPFDLSLLIPQSLLQRGTLHRGGRRRNTARNDELPNSIEKKKEMNEKVWSLQAKKVLPSWLYLQKWLWTADTTLVAAPQVLAQYQGWIWLQLPPRPINLSQRQIQCDCLFWQNGCKLNPPPPPITDCERCFLIRAVNQISKNPLTVSREGGKCQLRREWGNMEESHKGSVSTTSDSLCVCQLAHHHGEPLYPLT